MLAETNKELDNVKENLEKVKQQAESEIKQVRAESLKIQERLKIETEQLKSKIENEIEQAKAEKNELENGLSILRTEHFIEVVSIAEYENLKSYEIKNELSLLKIEKSKCIKDERAFEITKSFKNNNPANEARKKQILLSFNLETSKIIESVTAKTVGECRSRLERCYKKTNNIYAHIGIAISQEYLRLKLQELSIVYAYMVKIDEEREFAKEAKAQLLEEEKVRREIELEKQKIAKEELHFSNEISKLMKYMQKADDIEKQLYIDKIRKLEERLSRLEKEKDNVLERERNTRAGFVYIISNIGSFGRDVYKIGMTRRLEPMDRIKELSSASVPFKFDVHAIIFSHDAPALESILHKTFKDNLINKVNPRKEFFKINLENIKEVVKNNHNATVKFIEDCEAFEHYESVRLSSEQGV